MTLEASTCPCQRALKAAAWPALLAEACSPSSSPSPTPPAPRHSSALRAPVRTSAYSRPPFPSQFLVTMPETNGNARNGVFGRVHEGVHAGKLKMAASSHALFPEGPCHASVCATTQIADLYVGSIEAINWTRRVTEIKKLPASTVACMSPCTHHPRSYDGRNLVLELEQTRPSSKFCLICPSSQPPRSLLQS